MSRVEQSIDEQSINEQSRAECMLDLVPYLSKH